MQRSFRISRFLPFVLLVLVVVGCSPARQIAPTPTESMDPVQTATATSVPSETPAEQAEPAQVPTEPKPVPRAGLAATDPNSVQIGSGEPLLIEFFAFW
jgi:hypothetical protein